MAQCPGGDTDKSLSVLCWSWYSLIYALVTWVVGLSVHSKFVDDTKLDMLDGQDAGQQDLDKLEHWASANPIKFNKAKYNTLLMA